MTRPILRERFTLAFQNTDGSDTPSLTGDITATVEAPKDKAPLIRLLGKAYRHYFPEENYRLTTSWRDSIFRLLDGEWAERLIPVHGPGHNPPTPRRDISLTKGHLFGWDTAIIVSHAVNSAWAPKWKPTTWRPQRVKLWWKWFRAMRRAINAQLDAGRLVIVLIDGNRPGRWTFPGLRVLWKHGPDRIMIRARHRSRPRLVAKPEVGKKVGDGRVTHHSVRLTIELDHAPEETK